MFHQKTKLKGKYPQRDVHHHDVNEVIFVVKLQAIAFLTF